MKKLSVCLIIAIAVICAAACTPRSEDLEKIYKDNDYEIKTLATGDLDNIDDAVIEYAFEATKTTSDGLQDAKVISFADGNEATSYYNRVRAEIDPTQKAIKKGNTVIVGTADAVNIIPKK